jgi:hypothetical protein
MGALNAAALYSETSDLRRIQQELPDIPAKAVTDAFDLLRQEDFYADSAILIRSTRPGSLVISVTVAGVAMWVLEKTLGKTIEEAWKETEMHKRIKTLLSGKSRTKREEIADKAIFLIEKMMPFEVVIERKPNDEDSIFEGTNNIFIDVEIKNSTDKLPPNRKHILSRNGVGPRQPDDIM